MWTHALCALGWGHWKQCEPFSWNNHDTSPLDAKMIVWHVRLRLLIMLRLLACKIIDDVSYKIII
jgi:hypothetical protein